jgi:hypothetical protein
VEGKLKKLIARAKEVQGKEAQGKEAQAKDLTAADKPKQ